MSIFRHAPQTILGPEQDSETIIENNLETFLEKKAKFRQSCSYELDRKELAALMEGKALMLPVGSHCVFLEFNPR